MVQAEAGCREVAIERECLVDPVPAHDEEAHLIDEADAARGAVQRVDGGIVQRLVHPLDVERTRLGCESECGGASEALVQQRHRFGQDVAVGEQAAFGLQQPVECEPCLAVFQVAIAGQGEEGRRVDDDQDLPRSSSQRLAIASAYHLS